MVRNRNKVKKTTSEKVFSFCAYLIVTLFTVIALYPFINTIATSFSSARAISAKEVNLLPVEFNVEAYKQLLKDGQIFSSMKNTVLITIVGTTLNMIMTILAAYALSKKRLYGRGFFTGMIVFTMLFSGGMIPNFVLIKSLKLIDSYWALWCMSMISTYNMIVMKTSFEGIPNELCESALIDGANEPTILTKIILPLSKPTLATMVLFYAVGWWNDYFNSMLYINSSNKYPMMVKLKAMLDTAKMIETAASEGASAVTIVPEAYKAAAIIVVMVPIICVYPFLQKYFVKGVMVGSIKG